ncbi:uncharacterized protein I303_103678 [Kwoniella dejecticola CBS 10117]|uniref:Uncharacterized protein n=1 Tax=Kwoniella dejecticola CBS 10117 TaxID=1296121 RepID=A0A1A6A7E6_9TREE|nr:uncharacterized protein I303_03695 [Kwoniella dejecticola CBS 10117]OBR85980.1 hypothetical protein I303_03695 [Kwoniella dejecticola CBS 10117]
MLHHCLEHVDGEFIGDICSSIIQIPWSSCFSSGSSKNRPQSPDLQVQEGELETLLAGSNEGWDNSDMDMLSLATPRVVRERQAKGMKPSKPMKPPFLPPPGHDNDNASPLPTYESHLDPSSSSRSPSSRSSGPISGYSDFHNGIDEDARSLSINPAKLAEMAKHFEPTLTLDDIRREEEEQAERDREAERAHWPSMRHQPSSEGRTNGAVGEDLEEEFGEFSGAHQISQGKVASDP